MQRRQNPIFFHYKQQEEVRKQHDEAKTSVVHYWQPRIRPTRVRPPRQRTPKFQAQNAHHLDVRKAMTTRKDGSKKICDTCLVFVKDYARHVNRRRCKAQHQRA
jgi:hypothetical protein